MDDYGLVVDKNEELIRAYSAITTVSSAGEEVTEELFEEAKEVLKLKYLRSDVPDHMPNQKQMIEFCRKSADFIIDKFKSSHSSKGISLNELIGTHEAWPLTDVLLKLIESTEYLLNVNNYDRHGWEEVSHCTKIGRKYLDKISKALESSHASTVIPEK